MKFSDVDYINRTLKVQRQLGKKIGSRKLADCVDELQPFIEEVLPNAEQDNVLVTESMDVVINAKSYLS